MLKHLTTIAILLCLASCDEVAEPRQDEPEPIVMPESTDIPESTAISNATKIPEAIAMPEISGTTTAEALPELDLRLPADIDTTLDMGQAFETRRVLPNLFDNRSGSKKMGLGVRVVNDPSKNGYVDSISGAEITVEIPTN